MRTDQEILDRIKTVSERDLFGTRQEELIMHLSFEAAKPFLKEDVTKEAWEAEDRRKLDDESIKAEMLDYMPFAWEKANSRRGLSAMRSLDHMAEWLWLLGHDTSANRVLSYNRYGKGRLRAICEAFGWDWKQWDDGRWTDTEEADGDPPPETVDPLIPWNTNDE